MKAPANCRLIGRWRIVESDLWDRAHLDLSGPATLTITAQGGEIAFGALEGGLEVEYARDSIGFLARDAEICPIVWTNLVFEIRPMKS